MSLLEKLIAHIRRPPQSPDPSQTDLPTGAAIPGLAAGVAGAAGPSLSPSGTLINHIGPGTGAAPGPSGLNLVQFPKEGDPGRIASSVLLPCGSRIDFHSWCSVGQANGQITVAGYVEIFLVQPNLSALLSSLPSLSPNSRASSIPWIASMVESKLRTLGVDARLDLELLESASKRALMASFERSYVAVSSFFVDRVDSSRASDLWAEALARHVMDS